jgi:hypothetical protein
MVGFLILDRECPGDILDLGLDQGPDFAAIFRQGSIEIEQHEPVLDTNCVLIVDRHIGTLVVSAPLTATLRWLRCR